MINNIHGDLNIELTNTQNFLTIINRKGCKAYLMKVELFTIKKFNN